MTLLLAWSFDEASGAVIDQSGNGRGFSLSAGTVRTSAGGGYTYGGTLPASKGLTQTSAVIQAGPAITGLNSTSRTMEAWIKLSAAGTYWGMEYHQAANDTGVWGWLYLSSVFRFRAKNSANALFEVTLTPDHGNWHHLAATHDGTTLKCYRDGVLVGSGLSMAFPVWTADDIRVIDQGSTNLTLKDVRVYDTVLSAAQITTDMNTPLTTPAAAEFEGWGVSA